LPERTETPEILVIAIDGVTRGRTHPGEAVSAVVEARGWEQQAALFACIAAVGSLSYLVFRVAVQGARRLSPLALKLVTRLMGLLLAAVAVQFALNGLAQTSLFAR
jgi:multiple antibiotic resistance protein